MKEVLSQMRDFAQLEDFNRKVCGDDEYAKDYFENLNKRQHPGRPDGSEGQKGHDQEAFTGNNWTIQRKAALATNLYKLTLFRLFYYRQMSIK